VLSGVAFAQAGNPASTKAPGAQSTILQNNSKKNAPLPEPGELEPGYFSSTPPRTL